MKNALLTLLIALIPICRSMAQTRMISHKSHSGSAANFNKAFSENLFDIGESNFGMAPERFVRNSRLDTVMLISPKVAVMVTSEVCGWEGDGSRANSNHQELWSAGTDTVYDHPVFNSKNSIDEIKRTLKNEYYFANNVDKVVFIGFDGNYAEAQEIADRNKGNKPVVREMEVIQEDEDKDFKKRPSLFMIILMSLLTTLFKTPF